jgi:hypothetical protein
MYGFIKYYIIKYSTLILSRMGIVIGVMSCMLTSYWNRMGIVIGVMSCQWGLYCSEVAKKNKKYDPSLQTLQPFFSFIPFSINLVTSLNEQTKLTTCYHFSIFIY